MIKKSSLEHFITKIRRINIYNKIDDFFGGERGGRTLVGVRWRPPISKGEDIR